jgi:hypothetical protein
VTAIANMVPRIVETIVAIVAIRIEFPKAKQTSMLLQTPVQLSKVKPCQPVVFLNGSLKEKTNV